MPRYLIERTYTVDMDKVPTVATRSKAIAHHRFPEIVWEHSHVVLDKDGTPKSFCIYAAAPVPFTTCCAWKPEIGDVVDQPVLEPELLVSLDPRDGLAPDQVSRL